MRLFKDARVIFASANENKIEEIKYAYKIPKHVLLTLKDINYTEEIAETGKTYLANAVIKATALHSKYPNDIIIADDSGIEIEYLNNEPGIYSARYLGENILYTQKVNDIWKRMEQAEGDDRKIQYRTAMVVMLPDGNIISTSSSLSGLVLREKLGGGSQAYDQIFFIPELNKTLAQLTLEEKAKYSARGKAYNLLQKALTTII